MWLVVVFISAILVTILCALRFQSTIQDLIAQLPEYVRQQERYTRTFDNAFYSNRLYFDLLLGRLSGSAVTLEKITIARRWLVATFSGPIAVFVLFAIVHMNL